MCHHCWALHAVMKRKVFFTFITIIYWQHLRNIKLYWSWKVLEKPLLFKVLWGETLQIFSIVRHGAVVFLSHAFGLQVPFSCSSFSQSDGTCTLLLCFRWLDVWCEIKDKPFCMKLKQMCCYILGWAHVNVSLWEFVWYSMQKSTHFWEG